MEEIRILLDTSAYSAFIRGHQGVKASLRQSDEICLTPIILGELLAGFALGTQEKKNRAMLDEFLASPRVSIIPVDEETSERYAAIFTYLREKGTPIPTNDLWIAATAMQHGRKVLTTDNHYLPIPHILIDFHEAEK